MGNQCLFFGGCIGGTYRMSEGIAKETEGEHKGNIDDGGWKIGSWQNRDA
jgi:hypothetical protein